MTRVASGTCEVKQGLFRCKVPATGQCQYCGRHFCNQHGTFLEEAQEVCSRKFCVAKRDDVARHLVYREAAVLRNQANLCGAQGCERSVIGQCTRCRAYFCNRHVEAREEMIMENRVRSLRMSTLCDHCWARRPIWTRT